ncbi:hypothetical protein BC739_005025 [Kutzneria viridogrisea]|uniref:Uncharacterized protein n=2 Tax=Kutzneria TaxID=43356 RepID=A0ABR6BMN2_9PSEU|nr:hypothetical protein [Kutzneria albida]AHH94837.1 putative membrane protein [Kutzneria albida DSM 43870]MBA8927819.1 hypothetical protein [Kutzneria viridogrisea]
MNLADSSLETVMTLLLIRFGVIAAGIAVLVVIGFTVLVVLKRKGKLSQARKYIEPVARSVAQSRGNPRRPSQGVLRRTAARAVTNYLEREDDHGKR